MLRWQFALPRVIAVVHEPPAVQRLKPLRRRPVGQVTGADDVVDEVTLIIDEHLLRCHGARRIPGHDVVMVKAHDLCRATQLPRRFAVPEGEQDVAVGREENAALRVLQVACAPWPAD